jgi:hypothetical protein
MNARQHYRAPELVRRTACCKREAWTQNGKLWCPGCGQEVLTAAKVFARFNAPTPEPVPPSFTPAARGRRRSVGDGQGSLL